MRELKHPKIKYIEIFLEFVPWLTPTIVGKHLWPELYVRGGEPRKQAIQHAYMYLTRLEERGVLVRADSADLIFIKKGRDKRIGHKNFPHNQAVISFLINCYMHGYKVKYGGDAQCPSADGIVWANGKKIYIETDRNHHGPKALNDQMMKFLDKTFHVILYFVYPQGKVSSKTREDKTLQWDMEKAFRKKMNKHDIPQNLKNRILSSTYTQCSDPFTEPMTATIWREGGRQDFVSVL